MRSYDGGGHFSEDDEKNIVEMRDGSVWQIVTGRRETQFLLCIPW
jgi:hypothetical protein